MHALPVCGTAALLHVMPCSPSLSGGVASPCICATHHGGASACWAATRTAGPGRHDAHTLSPHACAVFSSGVGTEVTMAVLAITLTPIVLEARKTLSGGKEDDFRALPFL